MGHWAAEWSSPGAVCLIDFLFCEIIHVHQFKAVQSSFLLPAVKGQRSDILSLKSPYKSLHGSVSTGSEMKEMKGLLGPCYKIANASEKDFHYLLGKASRRFHKFRIWRQLYVRVMYSRILNLMRALFLLLFYQYKWIFQSHWSYYFLKGH